MIAPCVPRPRLVRRARWCLGVLILPQLSRGVTVFSGFLLSCLVTWRVPDANEPCYRLSEFLCGYRKLVKSRELACSVCASRFAQLRLPVRSRRARRQMYSSTVMAWRIDIRRLEHASWLSQNLRPSNAAAPATLLRTPRLSDPLSIWSIVLVACGRKAPWQ